MRRPSNPHPTAPSRAWLDLLPLEICARIAAHLTQAGHSNDALSLAETSSQQAAAVMDSLSNNLSILWSHKRHYFQRWTNIARPSLTSLLLSDHLTTTHLADLAHLITAPNLLRLQIPDDPVLLNALAQSTSVKHLTICLTHLHSHPLVFQTLANLDLSHLKISCDPQHPHHCFFNNTAFFNQHHNAIAQSCPNLTSLIIHSLCHTTPSNNPTWRMLSTINTLQHFRIHTTPPANAISKLRSLQSLDIAEQRNAHLHAAHIGSPVTALHTCDPLDASDISKLRHCPRLTRLTLSITEGAEIPLAHLLAKLPALNALSVSWPAPAHWDTHTACESPPFPGTYHYADAPDFVIFRMVRAAPLLRDLSITEVRMSLKELTQVLKHLGGRLHRFCTSVVDQEQCGLERLEAVLLNLARYNGELRDFSVAELISPSILSPVPETVRSGDFERRLLVAINRLTIRAPHWNPSEMTTFVGRMFQL